MELVIFARFHARPGNETAVAQAMLDNIPPSRAEPGCLSIHAFRSIRDPALFYIHSRWKDEAAFETHAVLPHTVRFLERVEPLIDHALDVTRTHRIDDLRDGRKTSQIVRSEDVAWRPLKEPGVTGLFVKVLRFDEATGRAPTILLRFEPGASYPAHNHPAGEEIFVLDGEVRLGKEVLRKGDYLYTAPGNRHAVRSEGGCVLLVNIPEEVEKLEE